MKAVADSNFFVSGLIWGGPPGSMLDRAALRHFHLLTSEEILLEVLDVLRRPHLMERLRVRGLTPEGVIVQSHAYRSSNGFPFFSQNRRNSA